MPIDPSKTYETHRPADLVNEVTLAAMLLITTTEDELRAFKASRDSAGTGGPILVGGRIATMPGSALVDLFRLGEEEGAIPCRLDEETGQVFIGEFVFVPKNNEE